MPSTAPLPNLSDLVRLFYEQAGDLGEFTTIREVEEVSQPYRRLLAHNEHMTVKMEEFHDSSVDVHVLATRRDGQHYSRKILLTRQSDGKVVQFGIPRLNLALLSEPVRREIEQEQTPLGRVLINHNVMREVQLVALWRVLPGPDLCQLFHLSQPETTYGRTALIYCDGEPAIELLEIVTPLER